MDLDHDSTHWTVSRLVAHEYYLHQEARNVIRLRNRIAFLLEHDEEIRQESGLWRLVLDGDLGLELCLPYWRETFQTSTTFAWRHCSCVWTMDENMRKRV